MIEYNAGYNAAIEASQLAMRNLMDDLVMMTGERDQLALELASAERTSKSLLDAVEELQLEVKALAATNDHPSIAAYWDWRAAALRRRFTDKERSKKDGEG